MNPTTVLIGPMCAGKSTVAALLAEKLDVPRYELDAICAPYYTEAGYDLAVASAIYEEQGRLGYIRYCKPFEAHAVARVLEDHPGSVIDFGAGHSVHEDPTDFAGVERALAPVERVILLLPSPDQDESIAILNQRLTALLQRENGYVDPAVLDLNAHFVRHPSNARLAKQTVYTNGRTPDEICAALLQTLP